MVVIIAVLAGIEACVDFFLLSVNGGAPDTREGIASIDSVPETDVQFVATGIEFLKEIAWWQNDPVLFSIQRSVVCDQVQTPPRSRLLFFKRWDRLTLIVWKSHDAYLEIDGDGMQLDYTLYDNGPQNDFPEEGLDLDTLHVDSSDALRRAEQDGGTALRSLVGNECRISMGIIRGQNWSVDYIESDSNERFLCLNVDPESGDVTKVEERGFKPCPQSHTAGQ